MSWRLCFICLKSSESKSFVVKYTRSIICLIASRSRCWRSIPNSLAKINIPSPITISMAKNFIDAAFRSTQTVMLKKSGRNYFPPKDLKSNNYAATFADSPGSIHEILPSTLRYTRLMLPFLLLINNNAGNSPKSIRITASLTVRFSSFV